MSDMVAVTGYASSSSTSPLLALLKESTPGQCHMELFMRCKRQDGAADLIEHIFWAEIISLRIVHLSQQQQRREEKRREGRQLEPLLVILPPLQHHYPY